MRRDLVDLILTRIPDDMPGCSGRLAMTVAGRPSVAIWRPDCETAILVDTKEEYALACALWRFVKLSIPRAVGDAGVELVRAGHG